MNLYQLFDIYSTSGEITSSGIYMLRSALKRLYEAYGINEGQDIEENSFSAILSKLEDYLKSENKTSKVIRENKYWIRRLIKFGFQEKYLRLTNDKITVTSKHPKALHNNVYISPKKVIESSSSLKKDINDSSDLFVNTVDRGEYITKHKKIAHLKTHWIIKLILIFIGLLAVGMVFIADQIHQRSENHVFEQFQHHQLIIAQSMATGLREFILEKENEIKFLSHLPVVQSLGEGCQRELDRIYQFNNKFIYSIRLIDSSGFVHYGTIEGKSDIPHNLPYDIENYFSIYQESPEQIHSALVQTSSFENSRLLLFVPFSIKGLKRENQPKSLKGKKKGFVIVEMDLFTTAESFLRNSESHNNEFSLLINQHGIILYHPDRKKIGEEFLSGPKDASDLRLYQYRQKLVEKINQKQNGVSKDLPQLENQGQVFAYSPFEFHEQLWAVIVTADYKEAHSIEHLHLYIAVLMISLICLVSLGGFIAFRVNRKRIMAQEEINFLEKKVEMEDQICRSEERLRAILESIASDRISIIDKNLQITWANRVAYENYGDIIGMKCYQVYKGLPGPCKTCPVQKTFKDGKVYSSEEFAIIDKGGKSILYLTSSSPIRDRQGNITSVVETSKDITERMRLQQKIKSKLDLLDTILTNMNDGLRVIDVKHNILFMNQNLIDLYGNQINQKCYHVFMGRDKPCNPCVLDRIFLENHQSVSFIKENIKKQLVEISGSVLNTDEGGRSIIEVVRDITERKKLESQLIESEQRRIVELKERYRFGNIIGKSPKMQEIYELIQVVAQTTTTVLLLGESGTGKELIARAIHYNSPQHNKPFVEVCCSVLSENLLESELFGHVKGAFTGAIRDKIGRFEMANNGSVFLDEVGDISLGSQVKLLRVIQEREFIPVGGEKIRKVNVRIIAATNKDLKLAVETKEFREDLYYRLNVVPIYIPPLRERAEDIPLLTNHFMEKFRGKTGKPIESITSSSMNVLMAYAWPGNIRELENAMEHAFVKCDGTVIQPEALPLDIRQAKGQEFKKSFDQRDLNIGDLKKEILLKVLNETNWNPNESARKLNISRATFYRWLKKYNIKREFVS